MLNKESSKRYIKSVTSFNDSGVRTLGNTPTQYKDRQTQYMVGRTATFDAYRAYLSNDYVKAEVQGVFDEDFYRWGDTYIRLSDVSSRTDLSTKRNDDYKQALFPELGIEYFPIGAKVKTMGNVWICVNASNISNAKTTALLARCNASYNSYDYYGNIISEPIIVENNAMLGNSNGSKENIVLMNGYFNVTCQLNGNTEQLKENSRIILGKKPYHITGLTDFIQEFTGDRESCHLLNFTIRVEEPTESDDLVKNFVANGDEYSFDCVLQGVDNVVVGEPIKFTPHFVKNEEIIESTEEYPIEWIWNSSNENVATVSPDGTVTALDDGETIISAILLQNKKITASMNITAIKEKAFGDSIMFTSVIPDSISQFDSAVISAVFKEQGVATNNALKWTFKGASKEDYSVVVLEDGKSIEVTCLSPSSRNLKITASYNGISETVSVALVGY